MTSQLHLKFGNYGIGWKEYDKKYPLSKNQHLFVFWGARRGARDISTVIPH